jgi:hypothetical protein
MSEEYEGGLKINYGEIAGKVWSTLNEKGPLKEKELKEISQLDNIDFHIAIGWLARENKISKDNEGFYKLDNTNLTRSIGTKAGKIWKIIDIWGEMEFPSIKRLTDENDSEVYSAIGWLARENKIELNEKKRYTLK